MADDCLFLSLGVQPVANPRWPMVVRVIRQLQFPILRVPRQVLHGALDLVQHV